MAGLPGLEQRTFSAAFLRVLDQQPDAVAHIDCAREWTFAESFDRSSRIAGGFKSLGVRPQTPVALLLGNTIDTVHICAGLALGGMIEVPINTTYKGEFLLHQLNNSQAETIVIEDSYAERLAAVAETLHNLRTVVVRGDSETPGLTELRARVKVVALDELTMAAPSGPVRLDPADLIAYMYTSGTTGPSKGVLTPHAQAYTYASREDQERPNQNDRMLVTVPLFHVAGQWFGVYQALIHQIPCFVAPSFSTRRYWGWVRDHRLTYTTMLGTMAELLYQQPEQSTDAENPLDFVISAPLMNDLDGFRRRFGVQVAAAYGSAEIGIPLIGPPETIVGGEVGFARAGYDLRLIDEFGDDVERGQVGELILRPHLPHTVMDGYHLMGNETAKVIRDGWIHTGDGFRQDEQGRYYFSDRLRDALRRHGLNVSSFELERVINEYPGVYESAVIAVPSELAEDDIKAVVVMHPGMRATPTSLTWFLVDRLPPTMIPRYLEFVDELPKTPTQKVQKRVLREQAFGPTVWDRKAAGIVLR